MHDSLRSMELQCKERVDLLEALRTSRLEAEEDTKKASGDAKSKSRESLASITKTATNGNGTTWLGGNTVPQASYADIPRPTLAPPISRPGLPPRPSYVSQDSTRSDMPRTKSLQDQALPLPSPSLNPPESDSSERARTPSPEKKQGGMLRTLRGNPREQKSTGKMATTMRTRPPPAAASKAATMSWAPQRPSSSVDVRTSSNASGNALTASSSWDPYSRSFSDRPPEASLQPDRRTSDNSVLRPPSPTDYMQPQRHSHEWERLSQSRTQPPPYPEYPVSNPYHRQAFSHSDESVETAKPSPPPPMPPPHRQPPTPNPVDKPRPPPPTLSQLGPSSITYMKEYPNHPPKPKKPPSIPEKRAGGRTSDSDGPPTRAPPKTVQAKPAPSVPRKTVNRAAGVANATAERQKLDDTSPGPASRKPRRKPIAESAITPPDTTDESHESEDEDGSKPTEKEWDKKVAYLMKHLPKGVDETAAKNILNEIVIQGDEVHWDDVSGLEPAKSALKETVVYPFLRPDLFMGLREPARGMLLFGPPGTGKTMLARAVATESKSVFFAISASSLTSKYLGESEKLVRALFALAKSLAPSIIFVDEIDSLLGSRGGSSEHEATRRIKTEFLIQWSDLQKAAAGRSDDTTGDATRVLVLAATNLPWAIDEAARRRFVRRQYIPLPEAWVRELQLRKLLQSQKHSLRDKDIQVLVGVTENYSGSDMTALAKDAAMGPLRSLGEQLLHMKPDEIRGIGMQDFEASLVNIRPSVGRAGLKEYEDWAKEFGERGG